MKLSIAILLCAFLLGGCAHFRSYDPVVADDVRELKRRSNEVVADGDARRLSLASSRRFIRQCQGQVEALRARGVQCGMKAGESAMLDALDRHYAGLLASKHPLCSQNTSELRATLFALQASHPVFEGWKQNDLRPVDVDTPAADPSPPKDCDNKNKHDHDDRDCGCKSSHR